MSELKGLSLHQHNTACMTEMAGTGTQAATSHQPSLTINAVSNRLESSARSTSRQHLKNSYVYYFY